MKKNRPKNPFLSFSRQYRILALFLVFFSLANANSQEQKRASIEARNVSITKAFEQINKKFQVVVMYQNEIIDKELSLDLNLRNASLQEALASVCGKSGLAFSIKDNYILITAAKRNDVPLTLKNDSKKLAQAQESKIKGSVKDQEGNFLIGTSVSIKGKKNTVMTDAKGEFTLDAEAHDHLIFSFTGFQTVERKVNEKSEKIEVVMHRIVSALKEVVIDKGYYRTTDKLNTGSVVQVNAEALERQPLANPIQSLQGLAPGLYVKQSSGMAGSASTVTIRGRNSISSGLIPLYIIDGVPFNGVSVDRQVGSGATVLGTQPNGGTDPLSNLNPSDIESITILKDADATAIYGSRGANGVILIKTKRRSKGGASLQASYSHGIAQVVNQQKQLAPSEYLALRKQAFLNDQVTPTVQNAPDLELWDPNAYTNYQDMMIGNTAKQNEARLSLSMGAEKSSLLMSGNYRDETSVLFEGRNYLKTGLAVAASHSSNDERLRMDFTANVGNSTNNMLGSDLASSAIRIPSNYPLYTPEGKLYWISNFFNPMANAKLSMINKSRNIVLGGNISYKIANDLNFKVNLGFNDISQTLTSTTPASARSPLLTPAPSSGIYTNTVSRLYITEPQVDYKIAIWKGTLNTTIGAAWQQTTSTQPYFIQANTFANESLMNNFTNAANFNVVRSMSSEYRYLSGFGVFNYNVMDKYVLNGVYRRDGSSRFGPGKKFGNFGSIGAAWIFSEENFAKDLSFLSLGKLRGSYGVTGNDQVDNYAYMDTYTSTSTSYGGNPGFYPSRIANPSFNWESNRKLEIAADFGFFKDRVRLTTAWYKNRSDNMVVRSAPLSGQTGFTSYVANLDAKIQNTGFEADLSLVPIQTSDLRWDVQFNISASKNKLLSLPKSLLTLYANSYQVGSSLNSIVVYKHTGFQDGVAQFEDLNNDGNIYSGLAEDSYVAGTTDPKFYGGISTSLTYKKLRLDVLFNFVKQKGIEEIDYPGLLGAQRATLQDSPFKPSATTSSASYLSYEKYRFSDAVITDASFMRLRNLSLAYSLNDHWIKALKLKNTQLFVRGQNLFTITKYKGLDPETQGNILPPLKMFITGIQCSF